MRALADFLLMLPRRFLNQGGNAAILAARSGVGLRQRLAVLLEEIVAAGIGHINDTFRPTSLVTA